MHTHAILVFITAAVAAAHPAAGQDRLDLRAALRDRHAAIADVQREQREQQTERTTRTLKVGASGEIWIGNIAGDITISRGSGGDATLEIVKVARARTVEEAREQLGLVDVDITERANRAEVKTRYPSDNERRGRRNVNVSVSFNLTAPPGTSVTASSISGSVIAKGIKGEIALESVSGNVRIADAGAVAAAKSISGDVEVVDTQIDGLLEVSSVSGSVVVRSVKARRLEASAVSGGVVVQDVASDRVEAQTVSGSVEFSGPLASGGRYELSSHSGEVKVVIAGNTGFELEATSFSGSVNSDITLKARESNTGRQHQRSLRGVYGDGSAVLELTTFSGSVSVSRR
jgi:hypothetical protein